MLREDFQGARDGSRALPSEGPMFHKPLFAGISQTTNMGKTEEERAEEAEALKIMRLL